MVTFACCYSNSFLEKVSAISVSHNENKDVKYMTQVSGHQRAEEKVLFTVRFEQFRSPWRRNGQ